MRRSCCLILGLVISLSITGCKPKVTAKPPDADPMVFVSSPTYQDITDYEEFIGHTDAVFTVEVRARVTGYLDKVTFNDGDEVEKGALLFQIDDRPYKAEFERMQATLEQGKARLTRLAADHNRAVTLYGKSMIGREEFDRINGDFEEGKADRWSLHGGLSIGRNWTWTSPRSPRRSVDD